MSRNLNLAAALVASAFALGTPDAAAQSPVEGALYTSTNEAIANFVVIYDRLADGTAVQSQMVPTGGLGTGAALGNQGAVTLSSDQEFLFVVNAGSDDLSVFRVLEDGLLLVDLVPTRGDMPISVAQHGDLVYVVHEGDDSITGFEQRADGSLVFIRGSRNRLSGQGTAPAQIGFSPDGDFLFVTERATQQISRFRVTRSGGSRRTAPIPATGITPFGFEFGLRDQLVVSNGEMGMPDAGTVTSYEIDDVDGDLDVITGPLALGETASCWIVMTPDRRIAFSSNTASATVSSLAIGFDGDLTLLDAQAATTGAGPRDMAVTPDGQFFYVLNEAGGGIGDYVIGPDGSLIGIPGSPTINVGSTGLAVR